MQLKKNIEKDRINCLNQLSMSTEYQDKSDYNLVVLYMKKVSRKRFNSFVYLWFYAQK
jgi:hypothetical protein